MTNPRRYVPALGAAVVVALGGGSAALAHRHGTDHDRGVHRGPVRNYSAWDKQWLQTSIEGDLYEIAAGRLAHDKGTTAGVRDYGDKLQSDHTQSLADATKVARFLRIEVPKAPTPSQQWELQMLGALSGTQFDTQFADLEAKDHQQDISESKDEVSEGFNRFVRHLAKTDLPMLQDHLQIALNLGGHEGEDPTSS